MLVIDPSSEANNDYGPINEMEGPFGQQRGKYTVHSDNNLVPRDVIPEEENERTQDSALLKITEEREETKKGSSTHDLNSESSPMKVYQDTKDDGSKNVYQDYEEDYEDDDEEPVPTKPFEKPKDFEETVSQEEVLHMINKPVERPTTRNPRMQRVSNRNEKDELSNKNESMGEMHRDEKDPESLKIQNEWKGGKGFELPSDSDEN